MAVLNGQVRLESTYTDSESIVMQNCRRKELRCMTIKTNQEQQIKKIFRVSVLTTWMAGQSEMGGVAEQHVRSLDALTVSYLFPSFRRKEILHFNVVKLDSFS